jgi:hypothetical protein
MNRSAGTTRNLQQLQLEYAWLAHAVHSTNFVKVAGSGVARGIGDHRRIQRNVIRKVFIGTLIVATLATTVLSAALWVELGKAGGNLQLDQQRLFLDAYKAIGIGVLVALLGTTLPLLLSEARDRFERFKASRDAYSQAKTSVMYLPGRIASQPFDAALASIQAAHEKLHSAETYREELRKHLHWHPNPETWLDQNYWEIFAIRQALYSNAAEWCELPPGEKLKRVDEMLLIVRNTFGTGNAEWARLLRSRKTWAALLRPKKNRRERKLEQEEIIEEKILTLASAERQSAQKQVGTARN